MIRKIFFTLLFLAVGSITYSQNQFNMSQSMMYQPFINPAVIGSYDNLNGALFYKNQWTGFDGAPEIGGFSINTPIKKTNHSIGLTVVNDRVGVSNNSDISAAYSYKLKFNNSNYVTLGVAGSMMLMQSNLAELDIIQEADPIFQSNTRTFVMPNAKFGAYYFRNKFYFGLAMPNLFKNNIEISQFTNFDPSNLHYFIHSGYQFDLNKDWEVQTSVLFKHVAGAPLQVELNGQFVYNDLIGLGICYRTSQELIGMLNYRISNQLKVGYAYDYNMRTIGNYSNGTHEIVLLFDLIKEKTTPIIEVPRF
jgi:type IX secretion system PorP/SprF family membrane protein